MAASIRSLLNGGTPITGASRNDLRAGDIITLQSVDSATTYAWTMAYKPEGSAATIPSPLSQNPGSFTVDLEGPYLIRLTVDLGLPTENTQFVRLRYLTIFEDFTLVAAGEQNNSGIPVPVDQGISGWADDQNRNLLKLINFVSRVSTSGRALYVDSNTTDGGATPDPVTGNVEGYGDFATVQEAINYAATQTPSLTSPWVILVRPGSYQEDLTLEPHVHIVGWSGNSAAATEQRLVYIQGNHSATLPLNADFLMLANLTLENISNSTTPMLSKAGPGSMAVYRSALLQNGTASAQGAAIEVTAGTATLDHCYLLMNAGAGASRPPVSVSGSGTTVTIDSCQLSGPSGLLLGDNTIAVVRDSRITSSSGGAGATGIRSTGQSLLLEYSRVETVASNSVTINPLAAAVANNVDLTIRWSFLSGDLYYDTTGIVGSTSLSLGSSEYGSLTFPGGTPGTLAATTKATSLFYDNSTSGLSSSTVQDALNEVAALAQAVMTLDDAYDGGSPGSGSGRSIVADQGAVQILDAASPADPPDVNNPNGRLQVTSNVQIGAIDAEEIDLDPNPYGNGPRIVMGQSVTANNTPFGSTAFLLGNSTGNPLYRNYNLRVGTLSSEGGGRIGQAIVRGGSSLTGGTAPTPGAVVLQSGSAHDAAVNGAHILFLPGDSAGGTVGAVLFGRPSDATEATLTGAGAFSGGVTGTIRFATDMGAIEVDIDAADNLATVLTKFNATGQVVATQLAGVITLTTVTKGPIAEVFYLNDTVGGTLDVALGTFDGQVQVNGTLASSIRFDVSADNEITIGAGGATGPMIYNSDTGKLTVPGIIDPIGLVLDQTVPLTADPGKGVIFIGDGTGGTTVGNFYYRYEGGTLQDVSAAIGGATTMEVSDEGSSLGTAFTNLNFTGSGVTAVDGGGGEATITITSGTPLLIRDEGVDVEANTDTINFLGAGVTAVAGVAGTVEITIPGGAGGIAVTREAFAASSFSFGAGVSTHVLTDTPDNSASLRGIIECYRNGVADMTLVVGIPASSAQFRISGGSLEIGSDITATGHTYKVVYPLV
jgi:hypothetical protein